MPKNEDDDDQTTNPICIVKELWPTFPPAVQQRDGQIEIIIEPEMMPETRPGQRAPILQNKSRSYAAATWEEAIRVMARGEGISSSRIETMISIAQKAQRDGTSVFFPPTHE